jgi:long-chain acyl-CoA synthetase
MAVDIQLPRPLPKSDPNRDWSGPEGIDPSTLYELFRQSTNSYGDQLAWGYIPSEGMPRIHLTYNEFGMVTESLRSALKEFGINTGDRVAMILDNCIEWAAAAYAANGLGAAYTGMYTHQHGAEWAYILGDSQPSILILRDSGILDRLIEHMPAHAASWPAAGVILLGDDGPNNSPPEGVPVRNWTAVIQHGSTLGNAGPHPEDPHALATLIYTSGTTGDPKGVMLSNWNILHNLIAMRGRFDIEAKDRTASFLPWAHSFGQMGDLHFMIYSGVHINLISNVLKIAEECQEIKPHALFAVPRVWNKLYGKVMAGLAASPIKKRLGALAFRKAKARIAKDGRDCIAIQPKGFLDKKLDKLVMGKVRGRFGGQMRFCISGGAALSPEVALFIQCVGFSMYEGYGLTETSPLISLNGWEDDKHCILGSVGRPIPGVRAEIDQDAWDDPDSDDGEILCYGPNVMLGYWNKPEATAEVMTADGGFRTGDLGRLNDGFIHITGRVKEQFKLENGKYVAPSPLEEALKLSALVEQCCVDGRSKIKTVTLVHPNEDALRAGLKSAGVSTDGSFADLCKRADVRDWVLTALKEEIMVPNWKGFEISGGVILDAEEWSTDNKLLTPSLKVKRSALLNRHGVDMESMR